MEKERFRLRIIVKTGSPKEYNLSKRELIEECNAYY